MNMRLLDLLLEQTKFDQTQLELMLRYGAVKIRFRNKGPWTRVRDGRIKLHETDQLQAFYDRNVLAIAPLEQLEMITENKHYCVCFKPTGIMSQGTDAGDQASILYALERMGKTPFLVHRLDRETQGLMLVAFSGKAAAVLSELFQKNLIHKTYLAWVKPGQPALQDAGAIDISLDGKAACTLYKVQQRLSDRLLLELKPQTGRLHQLRRHLDFVHHPIWGDPKYGRGNKNKEGLQLVAQALEFEDPWSKQLVRFSHTPAEFRLQS
jgi:tRNA pseudouridine32 synthase/23S rRNA pseudouridine746 synthase